MIPENLNALIKKLIDKTTSKKAVWSKTSRDSEFKLELNKGAIITDNWDDENSGMNVDFSILNEFGDIIERIAFRHIDVDNYNTLMQLHNEAKRSYYKVDETIKTIFDELDSEKIVGRERSKDDLPDLPF